MLRGERKHVDAKTGRVTTVTAMEAQAQAKSPVPASDDTEGFTLTVPLMVDVHSDLERAFSADLLNDELVKIRRALYFDLGIVFPGIQLRYNSRLQHETYSILLAEIPVSQGRLRAGQLLVRETPENLTALSIPFEQDRKFLPNLATIWTSAELKEPLSRAGIAFMGRRRC